MFYRFRVFRVSRNPLPFAAVLFKQCNDGKNAGSLDENDDGSSRFRPEQHRRAETECQRDEINQRYGPALRQAEFHEAMRDVRRVADRHPWPRRNRIQQTSAMSNNGTANTSNGINTGKCVGVVSSW